MNGKGNLHGPLSLPMSVFTTIYLTAILKTPLSQLILRQTSKAKIIIIQIPSDHEASIKPQFVGKNRPIVCLEVQVAKDQTGSSK